MISAHIYPDSLVVQYTGSRKWVKLQTLLMCMNVCLYLSVCAVCVLRLSRGQKSVLHPPELDLHLVGCHVGPGNQTQLLCKGNDAINH